MEPVASYIFTHADDSRGSNAFTRVCVRVCVSVCPHDKTKTAETTITKLATKIVHHESWPTINIRKVKGHGHRVTKYENILKAIEWPA